MPIWIVILLFALPLVGMIFVFMRRSAMLSSLTAASGGLGSGMLDSLDIDPTKPVQLEFSLSFPTREAAAAAAADLPAPQWSATVAAAAGDDVLVLHRIDQFRGEPGDSGCPHDALQRSRVRARRQFRRVAGPDDRVAVATSAGTFLV